MKTFEQLKSISEIYTNQAKDIPNNPFLLCNRLQIQYRYKRQCIQDFGGSNPLEHTPAILYNKGKTNAPDYVLYVDESNKYWRFYMFHEMAHYILEHDIDSSENEQEANMLTCLLIAPLHLLPTYLKSASDLSTFANIPIGHSEEYWQEIYKILHKPLYKRIKTVLTVSILSICLFVGLSTGIKYIQSLQNETIQSNSTQQNILDNSVTTPSPTQKINETSQTNVIDATEMYYVTPTGTKYHTADCRYVKNKTNIQEIQNPESKGYQPCSICIKDE